MLHLYPLLRLSRRIGNSTIGLRFLSSSKAFVTSSFTQSLSIECSDITSSSLSRKLMAASFKGGGELSRACQAPMVTADISAILWIRIAVIEGYLRERDEDLGTRRT